MRRSLPPRRRATRSISAHRPSHKRKENHHGELQIFFCPAGETQNSYSYCRMSNVEKRFSQARE
jgi:hypothetical protein